MSVRALDKNGDWTFGQGMANYLKGAPEVRQNVITRIKLLKNDWFLDIDTGIDWLNILANRNNRKIILDEVERITRTTQGVRNIIELDIIEINKRGATIYLVFTTIYDKTFEEKIGINV